METRESLNFEQLIINVFKNTCNIQSNEKSFEKFYDTWKDIIFNEFDIEEPTEEEFQLVKNLFIRVPNEPLCLAYIVEKMSKNPESTTKQIEDFTFECLVPIILGCIEDHRCKPEIVKSEREPLLNWAHYFGFSVTVMASVFYFAYKYK